MKPEPRSIALLAAAIALTACAGASTAGPSIGSYDFISLSGARVEVLAEGGIAALSQLDRVDHDSRVYTHVQRHLCGTTCGAPMDSTGGTASPAAVDSLFSIVLPEAVGLKDDYGTTPNAADMMTYTVKITGNGATKTVRADDGTMPSALRRIVESVRGTISAARK